LASFQDSLTKPVPEWQNIPDLAAARGNGGGNGDSCNSETKGMESANKITTTNIYRHSDYYRLDVSKPIVSKHGRNIL